MPTNTLGKVPNTLGKVPNTLGKVPNTPLRTSYPHSTPPPLHPAHLARTAHTRTPPNPNPNPNPNQNRYRGSVREAALSRLGLGRSSYNQGPYQGQYQQQ